jgi:lipase chaperone LimK
VSGARAAALAGFGALLLLLFVAGSEGPPGVPAPASVAAAPPAAPAARAQAPAAAEAAALPLPASLEGTTPGGELLLDASGRFLPGPEALSLFDYFFAASGEEPAERIRARIVAEIRRRLPPAAAAEAEALLERYLAYREGAAALFASDLSFADPERRFQRIRELRREVFGAGLAAALFGEEERILAVDLERQRVAQAGLAPEERARRLAALEAELPDAERRARAETRAALELRAAEAELRAAGAGPAAIAAERERRFGPEAAARLAALDERRAAWDERVAAYRAERDALRARKLPAEDYREALSVLRDARFEGPERLRVEALDGLEAEGQ